MITVFKLFTLTPVVCAFFHTYAHTTTTTIALRNVCKLPICMISEDKAEINFKLVTFNVLAPCYHKINVINSTTHSSVREFESLHSDSYLPRYHAICSQLREANADIIFLQEFWFASRILKKLIMDELCNNSIDTYELLELRRTSHWRERDDGLAVLTRSKRIIVEDIQDILFHDCGDRVAQLLQVSIPPQKSLSNVTLIAQQFLCVNVHLLFPHNKYSTKIRLREMTKVLGYVDSYRQRELCSQRWKVSMPIVIAGDFNGSPNGIVFDFMKKQGFKSAHQEFWANPADNEHHHSSDRDTAVATSGEEINRWKSWISHKSHRGQSIAVDHVFFSNPSDQERQAHAQSVTADPDWTDLVFRELQQQLLETHGLQSMLEIFAMFDRDGSKYIDRQEFAEALKQLGFEGEGTSALTAEEVEVLIDSADKNDDGFIDYKEFCDRFAAAAEQDSGRSLAGVGKPTRKSVFARSRWLNAKLPASSQSADRAQDAGQLTQSEATTAQVQSINLALATSSSSSSSSSSSGSINTSIISIDSSNRLPQKATVSQYLTPMSRPMGDLRVKSVQIFPEALERGIWPSDYTYSDHGMVVVEFAGQIIP